MDPTLKKLLVELARTTLRVLEPAAATGVDANVQPTPWATATNTVADRTTRTQNAPIVSATAPVANPQTMQVKRAERGSQVRTWTGDRYEVGTVEAIGRDKVTCTVRVSRGEGRRDKVLKVQRDKLVVV